MKKPSDNVQVNPDKQNDLEFEMCCLAFKYMEMGMSERAAFEIAEQAVGLSLLIDLKNELEASL